MTKITKTEQDLKNISTFIPRFFAALSLVVAAFPVLDRIIGILPAVLRYQDIAAALATIVAFAIVGGDFLSRKLSSSEQLEKMFAQYNGLRGSLSTGAFMLIIGVVLTVGYIGYADFITNSLQEHSTTTWWQEIVGIFWYLSVYGSLSKGFWQMSLRAYATKDYSLFLNQSIIDNAQ